MSERVAILAGAGGELGRGFAVVGIDRNEDGRKELPDGIRYEVGDPTDPAVARSLVERIAVEVGPPEVLVNTIGCPAADVPIGQGHDGLALCEQLEVETRLSQAPRFHRVAAFLDRHSSPANS